MISIKEEPYCEDRITKTGEFPLRTTKKLESSKEINRDGKRSHFHIPNPKTCPRYVQLQYDIKSPWLFGFIYTQNSIGGLVLYNRLNSIKIHGYLYLFLLPNYLLQTLCGVFSSPNLNSYLVFYY